MLLINKTSVCQKHGGKKRMIKAPRKMTMLRSGITVRWLGGESHTVHDVVVVSAVGEGRFRRVVISR